MDILKQKNRVEIFFWSLISKMRDKSQIWQVIVNENYSELFASGKRKVFSGALFSPLNER